MYRGKAAQGFTLLFLFFSFFSNIATITVNSSELYLSAKFIITSTPQIRNYSWTVRNETAAPDGFTRNVLVINSQFPGPLIEANEGDTLNIKITNQLSSPLTIHWHGIYQRASPWMDGVTGVTSCPIPAGDTFTYTFTINNQYGTFWYHAHAQNIAADGVAGPLIVHSVNDPLKRGIDFDQEIILMINDWYHDLSQDILAQLTSSSGYDDSFAAPSPNSALINGIGYFNCSYAPKGRKCETPTKDLTFNVPVRSKTRLRLIQAGSHALFRFSVDQHTLNVTEADATGVVGPTALHRVPFHNGQRYSVIINTFNDTVGSSVYLRAAMDIDCFAWLAPGITERARTALAVIRFVDAQNTTTSTNLPQTKDWSDTLGGACLDLDSSTLHPIVPQNACTNVIGTVYYSSGFGVISSVVGNTTSINVRFFVNDTTWITHPNRPLLNELLAGGSGRLNSTEVAAFAMEQVGCYDIVINNLDAGLDHSYHLHGVDGSIVAAGSGALNQSTISSVKFNTTNPLRRDTLVVGGGSYQIIRVQADNPGVWILHCHLGWHLGAGFAGVIVMQPSKLKSMTPPPAVQDLCRGIDPAEINAVEPGRKRRGLHHTYSNYHARF